MRSMAARSAAVFLVSGMHEAWHLPRWIDRLVPNLDLEGAALAEER